MQRSKARKQTPLNQQQRTYQSTVQNPTFSQPQTTQPKRPTSINRQNRSSNQCNERQRNGQSTKKRHKFPVFDRTSVFTFLPHDFSFTRNTCKGRNSGGFKFMLWLGFGADKQCNMCRPSLNLTWKAQIMLRVCMSSKSSMTSHRSCSACCTSWTIKAE